MEYFPRHVHRPIRHCRATQTRSCPAADGATRVSGNAAAATVSRRAALAGGDRPEYKRVNRLYRAAVRNESRERYAGAIRRGDRGGLWRVLRPVIGRKQQTCEVPRITPNALNDYYVSIGPATAASVPAATVCVPMRLPRVPAAAFEVRITDIDTLYTTLLSMKPSNSAGIDGMSVRMLQSFYPGLCHALLNVVNSSLATGVVPREWKHALVTPIPKGKSSAKPSDTRPISILPAIMKLVERIVQSQLSDYLEQNHLLSDAQHGYRKQRSTETALHAVTDRALQAMDNGNICILVLLDLTKCFDVVPHAKLLEKLSAYGVDVTWFRNYLAHHTQQVQMRSADGTTLLSDSKDNDIGVFQGGALSCVLYMIFSNDLCLCVPPDVTIVQFADDTQLMVTGRKCYVDQLIARMEHALACVFQWFCHNGMRLNTAKTKMLVIGTPAMLRGLAPVTLDFCATNITESKTVKNLGVMLDRHLSYEPHVDTVTQKCTGMLLALMHARHVIPRSALRSIVQSLVISVLRYCLSVYGSCGEMQLRRLQKVLNFCARVVTGKRRRDSVTAVIRQLKWLPARQLADYHTVCAVQRVIVSGQPECLRSTIGQRVGQRHQHDTRSANLFTLPSIRTEAGRKRLCYRGVARLNVLKVDPRMSTFRAKIMKILRSIPESVA